MTTQEALDAASKRHMEVVAKWTAAIGAEATARAEWVRAAEAYRDAIKQQIIEEARAALAEGGEA